jgi:hypothetical protein
MDRESPLSYSIAGTDQWYGEFTRDLLVCPACGFEYTHLRQTVVYQRKEDAKTNKISAPATGDLIRGGEDDNPSPRRDAVVLHFECECGHRFTVTFIQHKGQTFVWSEVADDGDEDETA